MTSTPHQYDTLGDLARRLGRLSIDVLFLQPHGVAQVTVAVDRLDQLVAELTSAPDPEDG